MPDGSEKASFHLIRLFLFVCSIFFRPPSLADDPQHPAPYLIPFPHLLSASACADMLRAVNVTPRPRHALNSPTPRQEICLTVELLRSHFHHRQEHAAQTLGISLTSLKSACRQLGIARWPYTRKALSTSPRSLSPASSSPVGEARESSWAYDQSFAMPHLVHAAIPDGGGGDADGSQKNQPSLQQVPPGHSNEDSLKPHTTNSQHRNVDLMQSEGMPLYSSQQHDHDGQEPSEKEGFEWKLRLGEVSRWLEREQEEGRTSKIGEEEIILHGSPWPIDEGWLAWYIGSNDSSNDE
eukprot:753016-Hanusia_phi.AAC.1